MRQAYVIALMLGLSGCGAPDPSMEDALFNAANSAVRAELKDPSSAQFSELYRCGQSSYVQGKVNAKNSFGGYTGFTGFVFDGRSASIAGGDESDAYVKALGECTDQIERETAKITESIANHSGGK